VKPSFLASKPFSIYTLIGLQVDVENVFNNVFRALIFKELQDDGGTLVNIIPLNMLFYGVHSSLSYSVGDMKRGLLLLNHLQTQGKVIL
jgi:hypothetical protein